MIENEFGLSPADLIAVSSQLKVGFVNMSVGTKVSSLHLLPKLGVDTSTKAAAEAGPANALHRSGATRPLTCSLQPLLPVFAVYSYACKIYN